MQIVLWDVWVSCWFWLPVRDESSHGHHVYVFYIGPIESINLSQDSNFMDYVRRMF